jgi:ParB-like chromosome segregation protein Spo0J
MNLKIEYVNTSELKTYAGNAKIHTAEQIEQIKKSITEYGFNDPIAVWKNNEVIEGHGRLIAALELNIDKVPVIRLDEMTDDQRRAYMLVHNQLTLDTGFDYDMLVMEIESLNMDLDEFGFKIEPDFEEPAFENTEYAPEEFDDEKFEYECPECGFRFNA